MKQRWTVDELAEKWSLIDQEQRLVGNKTGATRLGFVTLLRCFEHEGRFPQGEADIPDAVVAHLARLVEVPAEALRKYEWSGRTIEYHRAQIRGITPLLYQHVNPYGWFHLDMHERLPIDPYEAAA